MARFRQKERKIVNKKEGLAQAFFSLN